MKSSSRYEAALLFHENSKLYWTDGEDARWMRLVNTDSGVRQHVSTPARHFIHHPAVLLPQPVGGGRSLDDVLNERRTIRRFEDSPISLDSLGSILYAASGVSECVREPDGVQRLLRTHPSPGAQFPTDLYVYVRNVDGLPQGLYCYDWMDHALRDCEIEVNHDDFSRAVVLGPGTPEFGACILFVTNFERVAAKYGDRGYRFALIEVGHMAQNAILASVDMELGSAPIGAFVDDAIGQIIGLTPPLEFVSYAVYVGSLLTCVSVPVHRGGDLRP